MKTKRRVKVKFRGDGYLCSRGDIFYVSRTPTVFYLYPNRHTGTSDRPLKGHSIMGVQWIVLPYTEEVIHVLTNPSEADVIFMRGTHKFSYECEFTLEFKFGIYGAGSLYEAIVIKDVKQLDDDWKVKVSLTGPTSSNFTYYKGPLFPWGWWEPPPVPAYRNEFRGYQTVSIEITPQNVSELNHPQKKPRAQLLKVIAPYIEEAVAIDALAYQFPVPPYDTLYLTSVIDNVSIELKHKEGEVWENYDWQLATEHSVVVSITNATKKPSQPLVDKNILTIDEGGVAQGIGDEYVYDVVIREMIIYLSGIAITYSIPVRVRNWIPEWGEDDIMTTDRPWESGVRFPQLSTPHYYLVGYRHYSFPFAELSLKEISDLGFEVTWQRRYNEPDWGYELEPGHYAFKKKVGDAFVTAPKHIRSLEVTADQLELAVSLVPGGNV